MIRPAMGWWRETWIGPSVATRVESIGRLKGGTDRMLSLCARLPMHTVGAAYGLGSDEAPNFRDSLLGSMAPPLPAEAHRMATRQVREVLPAAIAERRRERRDDLIYALLGNRDPERWDDPDAYDLHRPGSTMSASRGAIRSPPISDK